ncbi:MAG TPA: glutathione S-transferase family protein [Burkholderiales bacterium]|nr:glutathione S-transferase family protein [Burkholderiales bacterium]
MLTFYYGSGSPFAWRVWLALEHKQIPYELRTMSFSSGELKSPEYLRINPRGRVPAIADGGFTLYESAAIVEYLDEAHAGNSAMLFPGDRARRAFVRRIVAENDNYLAQANERLVERILFTKMENWNEAAIAEARDAFGGELERFENMLTADWLAGELSAADHAVYPVIALALRMQKRKPELGIDAMLGPRVKSWMSRVESLPYFEKTYPPHWKQA